MKMVICLRKSFTYREVPSLMLMQGTLILYVVPKYSSPLCQVYFHCVTVVVLDEVLFLFNTVYFMSPHLRNHTSSPLRMSEMEVRCAYLGEV